MKKKDIRKVILKPGEIIPLNYNFMFTQIFNKKENISLVEYFLSDMANIPLPLVKGHVEILSRDLEVDSKTDKNNEIDLLLDLQGLKINFEISRAMSEGILERNIIYGCNVHKRQLKYGDNKYKDIKATIQIQLNNFICNDGKLRKTYFLRNEEGEILSTNFQIDVIDMVFGSNLWYTSRNDRIARWCRILRVKTEKDLKEVLGEDFMDKESTKKLIEEVKKYSNDEENYTLYMKLSRAELENNTIRAEIMEERERMRAEMTEKRERMRAEMTEKRERMRAEMTEEREKMRAEMTEKRERMRAEMTEEREKMKTEMTEEREKMKTEILKEKKRVKDEIEEEKRKMAKKLKLNEMPIDQIVEITELSRKEIEKL